MSTMNASGLERWGELCCLFDRLRIDELLPLAASLGAAFQAGAAGSSDITKAVGLTLYGRGLPRAALGEPFLAAFAALSASRSHATGATSNLLSFVSEAERR